MTYVTDKMHRYKILSFFILSFKMRLFRRDFHVFIRAIFKVWLGNEMVLVIGVIVGEGGES